MKKTLLLTTLMITSGIAAVAQPDRSWGIYGSLQLTQTKYTGAGGSLDVHWNRKHSVGLSLAWITRDANNIPADYDQYRRPTLFSFGDGRPVPDGYYIWTLSYGRYLPLERSGKLRLRLQAGLSAGIYEGLDNFRLVHHPASGGWILGSPEYTAYEYDNISRNLFGVMLSPAIEYVPARGFGFTAGVLTSINDQRSCMAANFGILFGRVRNLIPAQNKGAAAQH